MASGSGSSWRRMPTRSLPGQEVPHPLDADAQERRAPSRDAAPRASCARASRCSRSGGPGRDGGRAPWWTTQDGHLGRHLEDRLQDPVQARARARARSGAMSMTRSSASQVRAPVETRVVERAGQGAGRPGGPDPSRVLLSLDQEDPGVRVARGSLEEPEQEVGRTHDDTPHGRTSVYTPRAADRSGAVLGQAQGVGQDERHEVVGRQEPRGCPPRRPARRSAPRHRARRTDRPGRPGTGCQE